MEDPPTHTEDEDEYDEASVPTEYMLTGPDDAFALSAGNRKAAKRTFPIDLIAGETIQLVLPQPLEIPARKRPRLEEELFSAATDEATTENACFTPVELPAAAAAADATDTDSDPVINMHPNASGTRASRRWTPEEDTKLISAVTNTCKKKCGTEYTLGCSFYSGSGTNERTVSQ
jgi:hypothetical protein